MIFGSILLITAFLGRITLLYPAGFIFLTIGWMLLVTRWIAVRSVTSMTTARPWAAYRRLVAMTPGGSTTATHLGQTPGATTRMPPEHVHRAAVRDVRQSHVLQEGEL